MSVKFKAYNYRFKRNKNHLKIIGKLPKSLKGHRDDVFLLRHGQLLEAGKTGVLLASVISYLPPRPALVDLVHGPHLMKVLRKLVAH